MSNDTEMKPYTFDEYREVWSTVRNHCSRMRSKELVIKKIMKITSIEEKTVKRIYKDIILGVTSFKEIT
jgi:hypothetical protein